jgi:hypothetical protein
MTDILDLLLIDSVDMYNAAGTLVYANQACKLDPLSNQEAMTLSGMFDRTRFRMLTDPDLDLSTIRKITVVAAAAYPAGMIARTEGEGQPMPLVSATAHHQETILIKEQH